MKQEASPDRAGSESQKISSNEIIERAEEKEEIKAILANIYMKKEADRINILNT
jgi:hypothetical protein